MLSKLFVNIKLYLVHLLSLEMGGGRLERLVYKHAFCTFPTFRPPLRPLLHPSKIFVLDLGSCDALPVAPGPSSAAQIFELRGSQVDLARRARRSRSFDRTPVPSPGPHWAPLVPLAPSYVWRVWKQTGADGHMREGWGPPRPAVRDRHWHGTSAILSCWLAQIKVFWSTGFGGVAEELGFFRVTQE